MKLRAPHLIGLALIALGIIAVLAFQLIGIGKAGDGGRPGNLTAVTGVVG